MIKLLKVRLNDISSTSELGIPNKSDHLCGESRYNKICISINLSI